MAGLTKAQRAQRQARQDGLVPITKDGETIEVHPSCLAAHIKKGWRVIPDDSADLE